MSQTQAQAPTSRGAKQALWSVETYKAFWANPDPALVRVVLAPDIVGCWPRQSRRLQGVEAYVQPIMDLLELAPDLKLEVV